MDIKSLPTDNLYKFITIFCIALLFSCAYATVSIYESHLKQYQSTKNELFKLANHSESKHDVDKREYLESQIVRIESDKKTLMYFTFTGLLISIVGAAIGFMLWRNNLQKYLDLQIKLETRKLQNEVKRVNNKSRQKEQ